MLSSLSTLATVALAASSALAAPSWSSRVRVTPFRLAADNLVSACDGLGGGAFDTTTANVTLAAYYVDEAKNANATGVPLVLGPGGAISGASLHVLMTWASYPYEQYWPALQLNAGRLLAMGPNVTNTAVTNGSSPAWLQTADADPRNGAQVYCGVANTDPDGHSTGHPQLAVNGVVDQFALCVRGAYNEVIYKPSNASSEYNATACEPVRVQIVF
ncbi:uncharacterized protein BXZ73DRAFT_75925 [Epithele typhae]|uniref:uncharacterized protein n=1 Tax=Epithele typhae TaxID=378194 RepID=UPI0020073BF7|nr:uncharacterized protein BXZ73DRAFT_75925 [Epithele typhae]KAH9939754.1 hypothetical protein BXZ73DRAFT_75925 [Epithele typhae]